MKQEKIVERPEAPDNAGKQADAAEQAAREAERRMLRLESQVAQLSRLTAENSDSGVGWAGTGTIYRGFVETGTVQRPEAPWTPVLAKGNGKWQIKFLHAGYVRGPVTYIPYRDDEGAGPYELNPTDGEGRYYVGVKIDTELGSIVSDEDDGLLLSQTIEDVATFRLNPLPESKYFNKILCSLDYTSESDLWTIHYAGYAILPELGAYL